jgi:hypothetical protein
VGCEVKRLRITWADEDTGLELRRPSLSTQMSKGDDDEHQSGNEGREGERRFNHPPIDCLGSFEAVDGLRAADARGASNLSR